MKATQPKTPSPREVLQASEYKRKAPGTLDSGNDSTEQLENIDGKNIYDSDSDAEDINCRAISLIKVLENSTL